MAARQSNTDDDDSPPSAAASTSTPFPSSRNQNQTQTQTQNHHLNLRVDTAAVQHHGSHTTPTSASSAAATPTHYYQQHHHTSPRLSTNLYTIDSRVEAPPEASTETGAAPTYTTASAVAGSSSAVEAERSILSSTTPLSPRRRHPEAGGLDAFQRQPKRQSARQSGVSFTDSPEEASSSTAPPEHYYASSRPGLRELQDIPLDAPKKTLASATSTVVRVTEASETLAHYRDWLKRQRERQRRWTSGPYGRLKSRSHGWYQQYIVEGLLRQRPLPPSADGRHIVLDPGRVRTSPLLDERSGKEFVSNFIRSSRYTVYDFFPKQIVFQFMKLANFYFLIISVLQMIPGLSTTGTYTTIIPLMLFVFISMAKEGYDDYRRYRLDRIENRSFAWVLDPGRTAQLKKRQSKSPWEAIKGFFEAAKRIKEAEEEKRMRKRNIPSRPGGGISSGRRGRSQENNDVGMTELEIVRSADSTVTARSAAESAVDSYDGPELLAANTAPRARMPWSTIEWQDLRVGDIVRLRRDNSVPADMILLHADGPNGIAYIETMALDGETNLKTKQVCTALAEHCDSLAGMAACGAEIVSEDPNMDLYNYEGRVLVDGKAVPLTVNEVVFRGSVVRNTAEMMGLVVNTGEECKIRMNAHRYKTAKAPAMQSIVNRIVILLVIFVVLLAVGCTIGNGIWVPRHARRSWYLFGDELPLGQILFAFVIMFNTLIPLSLYVSLEIIKVGQLLLLSDVEMYDAETDTPMVANTTTILENLGQVNYIFSDKTGTLTENKMRFRKMSVAGTAWLHDMDIARDAEEKERKEALNIAGHKKEQLHGFSMGARRQSTNVANSANLATTATINLARRNTPPAAPLLVHSTQLPEQSRRSMQVTTDTFTAKSPAKTLNSRSLDLTEVPMQLRSTRRTNSMLVSPGGASRRSTSTAQWRSPARPSQSQPELKTEELLRYIHARPHTAFSRKARHFLLCIALCHTCLPETTLEGEIDFQAASPDELALVQAARDLGYLLIDRDARFIQLQFHQLDGSLVAEKYEVLDVVEFSSKRKRMSIVIRMPDGRISLFCKGADSVILPRLKLNQMALQKATVVERRASKRKSVEQERAMYRKSMTSSIMGGVHANINSPTARSSFNIVRTGSMGPLRSLSHRSTSKRSGDHAAAIAYRRSGVVSGGDMDEWLTRREREDLDVSEGPSSTNEITSALTAEATAAAAAADAIYDDPYGGLVDEVTAINEGAVFERCFQHIDDFASEGLRTLLFAYRYIEDDDYRKWKALFRDATTSLVNRQERIEATADLLEQGFDLAGATAIEDKLQEGVPETIDKMRRANIKIWMLTGDKRETAINIAHAARICKPFSEVYILDATTDGDHLQERIASILIDVARGMMPHSVVVIDGHTLSIVEEEEDMRILFFDLAARIDSVICCRASPAQKATLVKCIRERVPSSMTLAIGDGANDIAMIQASHVGIGISGREGMQAARISDYSIAQFRFLQRLLLVHGRWNYIRTGKYILATFWKEMVFYLVQAMYQKYNGYTGTSLYESTSLTVFNTLFTSLPVILLGIFEKDLRASTLLAVPELYSFGQRNMGFRFRKYFSWMIMAVAEASIIYYVIYGVYLNGLFTVDTTLYAMGSLAFTICVVFINIKMLVLEMHNKTVISSAGLIISIGGWFLWSIFLSVIYANKFGPYLVHNTFLHNFGRTLGWWATGLVALAAVIILELLVSSLRRVFFPTDQDLMQEMEHNDDVRAVLKEHAAENGEAPALAESTTEPAP